MAAQLFETDEFQLYLALEFVSGSVLAHFGNRAGAPGRRGISCD
jgi:hypothetical protein